MTKNTEDIGEIGTNRYIINSKIGCLVFAIKFRNYPVSVYDNIILLQNRHNLTIHPSLRESTRDNNPEMFTAFDQLVTTLKEFFGIEEETAELTAADEVIRFIASLINNGRLPKNISEVESVQIIDCKQLNKTLEEKNNSNQREFSQINRSY
jgi:hypothetical protein